MFFYDKSVIKWKSIGYHAIILHIHNSHVIIQWYIRKRRYIYIYMCICKYIVFTFVSNLLWFINLKISEKNHLIKEPL